MTPAQFRRLLVVSVAVAAATLAPAGLRADGGGQAEDVAAGPIGVWATDASGVVRLDAESGRITGRVTTKPGGYLQTLATGEGAVWSLIPPYRRISRIDPLRSRLLGPPIRLRQRSVAFAAGAGALWVADYNTGTLRKLDPRSGRRLAAVTGVGLHAEAVAATPTAVWVASIGRWTQNRRGQITPTGAGTVTRVDPRTDRIVARIPVGRGPSAVAVNRTSVWVVNSRGLRPSRSVSRIDISRNRVVRTFRLGREPAGIAVADGAVWVVSPGRRLPGGGLDMSGGSLIRIDPLTERASVRPLAGSARPAAITVAGGSLWIGSPGNGSVLRVDLRSLQQIRIPLGRVTAPWSTPLTVSSHPPGWHAGASGTHYQRYRVWTPVSTAWAATLRCPDCAISNPPNATLPQLPEDGIIVWASIQPPDSSGWPGGGRKLSPGLSLADAYHFPCCEAARIGGGAWELYGLGPGRAYTVLIRVYWGSPPITAMKAAAQRAIDALQLPPRGDPSRAEPERAGLRRLLLGRSELGRPIGAVHLKGTGAPVLVVGCIHGDECAGTTVVRELLRARRPVRDLWLLPNLNPDGFAAGRRQNGRGVDLNRNFPSQWRPLGTRWDPEYAGPAAGSERETRIAIALIERVRPRLTIWFHQHHGAGELVRAWGQSLSAARRYARAARIAFRRLPWPHGTAPNWQNHRFPGTSSFVVELPRGPLARVAIRRHLAAILRLSHAG